WGREICTSVAQHDRNCAIYADRNELVLAVAIHINSNDISRGCADGNIPVVVEGSISGVQEHNRASTVVVADGDVEASIVIEVTDRDSFCGGADITVVTGSLESARSVAQKYG